MDNHEIRSRIVRLVENTPWDLTENDISDRLGISEESAKANLGWLEANGHVIALHRIDKDSSYFSNRLTLSYLANDPPSPSSITVIGDRNVVGDGNVYINNEVALNDRIAEKVDPLPIDDELKS